MFLTRPREGFGIISSHPDGSLTLPVINVAGQDAVIETSLSLVNPVWTPIATNLNSGGEWEFLIFPDGETAQRFFRVRQLP